jgi:hypothetical protein
MICATRIMKPGGARIGHIAGNLSLPRTIPLVTAISIVVGAFFGGVLGVIVGGGFNGALYGLVMGGAIGWFATNFSPLQGESLATWLMLQFGGLRSRRRLDGKVVTLAVGVSLADRYPLGKFTLVRGTVRINPHSYDERGVLRSNSNKNLDDGTYTWAHAPSLAEPTSGDKKTSSTPDTSMGTQSAGEETGEQAPPWGQMYRKGKK